MWSAWWKTVHDASPSGHGCGHGKGCTADIVMRRYGAVLMALAGKSLRATIVEDGKTLFFGL